MGKGTITYYYGADGGKLSKIVVDSTSNPVRTIRTDYVGELVYRNDSLEFIPHASGRIRATYVANNPVGYVYDYFVTDHLDNTRLILTEQSSVFTYAATMEKDAAPKENLLFSNVDNTRTDKPVGYPSDESSGKNSFVAKLNAKAGGQKVGPSLVLRVIAGDTVNIGVKAFYKSVGTRPADNAPSPEDMVASLLQSFGGSAATSVDAHNISSATSGPLNANFYNNEYQRLKQRDADPAHPDKPRAYLNYALFDDQFNMVDDNSGVRQVKEEPDQLQTLGSDKMIIKRSGFLYVYTSNETQQDVYFDNLVLAVSNGPVLEETHYYPGGLVMDGISYRAVAGIEPNRVLFQGKELQRNEFSDGTGLDWYDFEARYYDPQLGRWFSPDPARQDWSPYMAMGNRFITVRDPDGRFWHIVAGALIGGTLNLISHADKIHSWQDGLVAFGIGAAAGALGAATGGASLAAFGGTQAASTFIGGAISGAVGSAYAKAVEGGGNMLYFGDSFKASDIVQAAAFGAATGGAMGTISGALKGKTGLDLLGRPNIKIGGGSSIGLSSNGKGIDPVYSSNNPRLATAGLGEGGSMTFPEFVEGNIYRPAHTIYRDGTMVLMSSAEDAGAAGASGASKALTNLEVNINLNQELGAAGGINSSAHLASEAAKFSKHLSQLEKYGQAGFKELQNGRFRYYGNVTPASTPGEMIGRRVVREWNPATGGTRTWMETLDGADRIRIVRPETGGVKVHFMFDKSGNFIKKW
ncbi:RHS repeat-associated core domain-containing protein [Chitinophaga eiseniae]|uniref:RHS repeat-associated core domain-containing protein n=1 Tax=Chitinophaga eiseniae TaxID=634771 RepID=A0A1T4QIQ3_9BACT|nr:RHS repeat-associated core domain-containing protein [Chitinophaga eiseniae]